MNPHVQQLLDHAATEDERKLILVALTANQNSWLSVNCKHCRRDGRYEVEEPNTTKRAKALQQILAGRPTPETAQTSGVNLRDVVRLAIVAGATPEDLGLPRPPRAA